MKKNLLLLAVLLGIIVAVPFWSQQTAVKMGSYPWQVQLHENGLSTVFGLTMGQTTMSEARAIIGEGMRLALLSNDQGDASVEMYYAHFNAGRITGRLVIVADLDIATIDGLRERAVRSGGANRFRLHSDDVATVMQAAVGSVTFIPVVDLDEQIINERFGKAHEIISTNSTLRHYLYPDMGLDLILDSEGKEVLQYVAPRDFSRLRDPLKKP